MTAPDEDRAHLQRALRANRDAGGYSSALRTLIFAGSLVLMLVVAAVVAIAWGLS